MTDGLCTFDGGFAIVPGAGCGIGRAISEALCAAWLPRKSVRRAAAFRQASRCCDFAAVSELVTETIKKLGRIDHISNNAGIVVAGKVANYTIDAWHRSE